MGDVLIILWLPLTIAMMAVAFVVTLGAAAGSGSIEQVGMARPGSSGPDDRSLQ